MEEINYSAQFLQHFGNIATLPTPRKSLRCFRTRTNGIWQENRSILRMLSETFVTAMGDSGSFRIFIVKKSSESTASVAVKRPKFIDN